MALEDAGFRFVEMVYGLRLDSFDGISPPQRAIQVAEATPGDLSAIEEIAHSAFTTGRFLLDPRLPPELSQRRYATWVRNSFGSSGQTILKAEVDGEEIPYRNLRPAIGNESDRNRRERDRHAVELGPQPAHQDDVQRHARRYRRRQA